MNPPGPIYKSGPMDKSDPIDKLDLIILLLHSIEDRITKIETHIAQIDETNTGVEKDCSKMRDHIQLYQLYHFAQMIDSYILYESIN